MPRYHYRIGFPNGMARPTGLLTLDYSAHARGEANRDRYGNLTGLLPDRLNVDAALLVEATTAGGRIQSLVYRVSSAEPGLDLVLVVSPCTRRPGDWFVRTVWANRADDTHMTLDRSKYQCP